ncbi:MAG: penicillin acylase family protein, partial [Actinomycetes bacterium]
MKKPLLTAAAMAVAAALAGPAGPAAALPAPSMAVPAEVAAETPALGITIKRDTYGVPHVYADTTRKLFTGYGYAVAEDRLFQMDMARRAVLGTSAEVLGPEYLEIDRRSRSSFDPAAVRSQIDALPQEDRDILDGYAEGMNRKIREVLAARTTLLPKQFTDYRFEPTEWSGYDVAMIFVGTMANRFSDSAGELSNLQVLQQLTDAYGPDKGQALFDQILWTEDPAAPTTVPREDKKAPNRLATGLPGTMAKLQRVAPDLVDDGVERMKQFGGNAWPAQKPEASNLWIVGSKKNADKGSVLL